ncbi:MAG: class I SAM-dependent methyltransferase [Gemmataceae bacterium]|nr:class I SAM-dependent methyltransferase [Gemmataceae bacterium]
MSELSRLAPAARFSGLAELYAKCRPTYPDSAVTFILGRCGLKPGSLLVDVGCGTGISARLFAQRGVRVLGVEPNEDMRRRAEAEPLPEGVPVPEYRAGTAEATGLMSASADGVLAAQAFHWFEPDSALREFHRILRPGGWVALVWNERDPSDPFTAAYGAIVGASAEAKAVEGPRAEAGRALLSSPRFEQAERTLFANEQELDCEGMLGRAFSASYAPREGAAAERFAADLEGVFARFERGGRVVLLYQTSVWTARRGEHVSAD